MIWLVFLSSVQRFVFERSHTIYLVFFAVCKLFKWKFRYEKNEETNQMEKNVLIVINGFDYGNVIV